MPIYGVHMRPFLCFVSEQEYIVSVQKEQLPTKENNIYYDQIPVSKDSNGVNVIKVILTKKVLVEEGKYYIGTKPATNTGK